jgi:flagellar biosynthesis protein FlhG
MYIIPIASGKGGVGKSLLAANLGVAFAQAGKRVVLVDLDLGASNLHLVIGYNKTGTSLGTWLSQDKKPPFDTLAADTDVQNLRFIPGDAEIPGLANLKLSQRNAIIRGLRKLDCDMLILDLGAGTHQSILDFFLMSGRGIVVATPVVTSTLNAYVFLKNALFRLMYTSFPVKSPAYAYLERLRTGTTGLKSLYLPKILEEIAANDPKSYKKFYDAMTAFHPALALNMLDKPEDADVGMKIRRSCKSYLGLNLEHLGVLYRDSMQDVALKSRLPIVLYKPQSVLSQAIYRIADKVLQNIQDESAEGFDFSSLTHDESYEEAALEAAIDFSSKKEDVAELLHSGVLNQSELLETVESQQLEISKLRKENDFLRVKVQAAVKQGFNLK